MFVLAGLALVAPASGQIVGAGVAIDGDTLEVGGLRLRLYGVDAPETDQMCSDATGADWPCGAAARIRLAALIAGGELQCEAVERDLYGRIVARCAAGGVDVAARLAAEGLAWAYTRYSRAYAEDEAEARAAGRGIWQGAAVAAWDWRRAEGWRAAAGAAAGGEDEGGGKGGCAIKGNVNAAGERIYHTRSSPWYDRVRVNGARGKRWFCSEAEAEAAGWRPAGGRRPARPSPDPAQ